MLTAPLPELLERLGTSDQGLAQAEAESRRTRLGPNQPGMPRTRAPLRDLARATLNPLNLILLSAGAISAGLGQILNAAIIAMIVLLSAAINYFQTARSDRALRQLTLQVATTATVCRDGRWQERPRTDLVVGDLIRLTAGDLVPADVRLIQTTDLHVQQAELTGESLPVEKHAQPGLLSSATADCPALAFQGTSIVSGTATALVCASGADTAYGHIAARLGSAPDETDFERGLRSFSLLILRTVMFLVLLVLLINLAAGRNGLDSLLFSVALAVGLTPEFLPMITSVTLAHGALRMARSNVIVKHLAAIENLGAVDILCTDKTGTLTVGALSVEQSIDALGAPADRPLALARINSVLQTGTRSPLDVAILSSSPAAADQARGDWVKTDEIPFDFERRRLAVVARSADRCVLIVKGAPESMLGICAWLESGTRTLTLDQAARARCLGIVRELSAQGLRVLAVGSRALPVGAGHTLDNEHELTLAGFLAFSDPILPDVAGCIQALRRDGVQVKILSGDHELVAAHVCSQAGVPVGRVVLGEELDPLDDSALALLAEQADVFARVSPMQKNRIVRALRSYKHVVGFLGDGINDAPSLHDADVGISAFGAVDIAREASDIVLLERRLDVLHSGIMEGRRASGNVLKYLLMGTSSNFGNMLSMAGAAAWLPFLPMRATQLLLNNFLYDLAQLTIPSDHVDPRLLAAPRRWNIALIRSFMLIIGPLSSLFDFVTFYVLLRGFGFAESAFQTGWFLESLVTQVLVLFVIRTVGRPWSDRPSIPLVATTLAAVATGVVLPYSPLGPPLGLVPLPPAFYAYLIVVVIGYLALVEVAKRRLLRRAYAGGGGASRNSLQRRP